MQKAILATTLVLSVLLFLYVSWADDAKEVAVGTPEINQTEPSNNFLWRFAEAQTQNPDGLPQTSLFLTIGYSDKTAEQLVDTVDGSCTEIEGEQYEGDISDTGKVQCYAAGLGQQYRITKEGHVFFVERKFFEEGVLGVEPAVYEWEVIQEFSFL